MSKLRKITDQQLVAMTPLARSFEDLAKRLELSIGGKTQRTLERNTARLGLSTAHFLSTPANRIGPESIFTLDRRAGKRTEGGVLKRYLLASGVASVCAVCSNGPEWNGMPLILEVDHIDGNPVNNEFGNLRLLCPNCHSQTETFRGKNQGKIFSKAS